MMQLVKTIKNTGISQNNTIENTLLQIPVLF